MAVLVSFEDKKQAIAEWIASLSGVPLENIRGADETGKFKYSAVELDEISEIDTHRPFRRVEEIDGVLQFVVYASRQVMVDIHFITRSRGDYTEPPAERIPDAGNYMAQFQSSLYLPEKSIEFLSKNALSLLSVASPLRADKNKKDGWQRRRIIEIGFGYISQTTEPISTIESIQNIKGTTYVLNDAIELEINLGPYQPIAEKGQPGGYAALDLNGEVPVNQLPDRVRIRVFTVASEIEQLALTVHEGYICVRTDESKSYAALNDVNNSLADWRELNAAPDASVITEDALHRFVTDADKVAWNAKQDAAEKGQPSGYASLDGGGKLPTSELPPLSITSAFVVNSEAAQLALTVEEGDVAIRTDENKTYIALNDVNASMSDWQELLSPTGGVLSVDGRTGTVTLDDLYVNTSGSSIVDQIAIASDASGNVDFAPVTVNSSGDVKNMRFTEQDNIMFMKFGTGIKATNDGTAGGALRGYIFFATGDIIKFFHGGGNAPSLELNANNAIIKPTTQSTFPTTGALQVNGGAGIVKNANIGGDLDVAGIITGNTGFVVKPSGSSSILLTDANKWVEVQNGASAATITIEPDTTADLPIGSSIFSSKIGDGEVIYAKGAGVTFGTVFGNVDFKIDGRGDKGFWIQFIKRAANTWYVTGPIKPV